MTKRVLVEAMQLVALSGVIGAAFNAANPIGLRWSAPATPQPISFTGSAGQKPTAVHGSFFRNQTLSMELLVAHPSVSPAPRLASGLAVPTAATWSDVKPLLERNGAVLIDARPKNYFDAGHIPRALSLPESSSESEFAAFRAQHDINALLVVYCGSPECPASKRLAQTLAEKHGYRNVRYLPGGYQEWQRAELSGAANASPQ
jgi:rhodanese-related sulfurtransferase